MANVGGVSGAPSTVARTPMIRAAAARNRGGHGDRRPPIMAIRCGGTINSNSPSSPPSLSAARHRDEDRSASAIASDAIKLHSVVDQAEAEPVGDPALQFLEFLVDEFDDLAGLDVDQMVVMRFGRRFVA